MASKSTKKDLVQHIAKALEVSPVEAERVMHTGQPVPIPPRKTIKLKVSKDLKEAMEPSETVRTGGADFDAQ